MLYIEDTSLAYSNYLYGTSIEIRKNLNGFYVYHNSKQISFDNFAILRESNNSEKLFLFISTKNNLILFEVYKDYLKQIFSIENTQRLFPHNNKPLFKYIVFDINGFVYVMEEHLIPELKITQNIPEPESQLSIVVSPTETTFIPSFDLAIKADCSVLKSIAIQATRPYESDIVTVSINLSN